MSTKSIFYLIFVTICFQFNDVKVGPIKISEILLLIIAIALTFIIKSINRYIFYFLFFFIFLLLKTFILNLSTQFYINSALDILRKPYWVTLSRFTEIFCCLTFTTITYLFFKVYDIKSQLILLKKIILVQFSFVLVPFLFIFLLYRFNFLTATGKSWVVYDSTVGYGETIGYRLKGLYNEGGPFGLFLAFLLIIYDALEKNYLSKVLKICLLVIIVFLCQSKAGMALSSVWLTFKFFRKINSYRIKILTYLFSIILLFTLVVSLYFITSNYLKVLNNNPNDYANLIISDDDLDGNTLMGRVSGMIIIPNMIKNNFLLGIGLGNYPLLRNNPSYRDFFPEVPVNLWDAHGFGGIVDILVDGGILFILAWIVICVLIFKNIKRTHCSISLQFYFAFILPFLFGVQLHFLYPWFILGVLLAILKTYQNENNRQKPQLWQASY